MIDLDPGCPDHFRLVLGRFASGLCVVTAVGAAGPVGLTVQSLMSLSLRPPLVALGVSRQSAAWAQVRRHGRFRVNLLADDQAEAAAVFGRPGLAKFSTVAWRPGPDGLPELARAHGWISCEVDAEHPAGDHWLVVAAVRGIRVGDGGPLVYHQGRPGGFSSIAARL